MSAKSAYFSPSASYYANSPSYIETVDADITGLASGVSRTIDLPVVPIGKYLLIASPYMTGDLSGFTVAYDNNGATGGMSLLISAMSGVRDSSTAIVESDGTAVITLPCNYLTSGGSTYASAASPLSIVQATRIA
jgi:hypothetical protein